MQRSTRRYPAELTVLGVIAALAGAGFTGAGVAVAAPVDDCATPDLVLTAAAQGNAAIDVSAGQVVELTGGVFRGGINQLPAGGVLCVDAGATLDPSYLNNAQGAIVVQPGGVLNAPSIAVAAGFELDNYGTATFAGLNVNGNAELHNRAGATLTIEGGFSPAAGNLINDGTMTVNGSANLNGQVALSNTNQLIVQGSLTTDGRLDNTGVVRVSGGLTVNGSGALVNSCGIDVAGDLMNTATGSSNAGLLAVGGTFTNNGTWAQPETGTLTAVNLVDDQTITGFGSYRFTGSTSVQGSVTGTSAADPIVVDTGQDPPFGPQTGTIANVVAGTVTPGSVDDHPAPGCADPVDRASADVQVSKVGPSSVQVGSPIEYTIAVTNAGPDDAQNVVATDTLPADLVDPVASDGGSIAAGVATWNLGTLPAGATLTRTVSGLAPADPTTLVDTARSTADTPDPVPANNNGGTAAQTVETVVEDTAPVPSSPPTAADLNFQITAGTPLIGLGSGASSAGLRLTYQRLSDTADGTARMSASALFLYVPDSGFSGVDSFTYRVCDSQSPVQCSAPATITITVVPRALDDEATTRTTYPVTIPVSSNDTPSAQITRIVSGPQHGGAGVNAADGTIEYNPGGYLGDVELVYETCAVSAPTVCAQATVTIHVIPNNDPPQTVPTILRTVVGTAVSGELDVTDPDGDNVAVGEVFEPNDGTETIQSLDTTYTPRPGFAGVDVYLYTACDDGYPELCTTGLVRAIVAPIATDDAAETTPGAPVLIDVRANDQGEVDQPGTVTDPAHGTAVWDGNGFRYTPAPGFTGTDSFTYRICAADGSGICADATVTVTVAADSPVDPTDPTDPTGPGSGSGSGTGGVGSTVNGAGPSGGLAVTGAEVGAAAALGLGLLLVGGLLWVGSLRRTTALVGPTLLGCAASELKKSS